MACCPKGAIRVCRRWEKKCAITEGIAFTIPGPDKTKAPFWEAKLDHYGQSVDQRVKFAGWMKEFAKHGGNLVIQDAGPTPGYRRLRKSYDLLLVAAGKGEINRMFEPDEEKSPYHRADALPYVKNMVPRKPFERCHNVVTPSLFQGVIVFIAPHRQCFAALFGGIWQTVDAAI